MGPGLPQAVGTIFSRSEVTGWAVVSAFAGVTGTMIAYFAAVVINFGDFARNVRTEKAMRRLPALPGRAGRAADQPGGDRRPRGQHGTDGPGRGDIPRGHAGHQVVANFIPPSYSLSNINPEKISFRRAGLITAVAGFIIGALWVAVISNIGLPKFVDTLGAVLAPLYGIIIADYYLVRKQRLILHDLYSTDPDGAYWFTRGWNQRAVVAFSIAAVFSILAVWLPQLAQLSGFAWIGGAILGALFHWLAMCKFAVQTSHEDL